MKCVGLFACVLLLQLYLTLRQHEKGLKSNYNKATAEGNAKNEELKVLLEKQKNAKFEDIKSDFTNDLDGIPIPEVTVTLNDFKGNLDSSFSSLETTLNDLLQSTSSTLASTSNNLSSVLQNVAAKAESFDGVFALLSNNLNGAFSSIQETVTNLNIGTGIPRAVSEIKETLMEVFQIVNGADRLQFNVTQAFDDAAFSVGAKLQVLVVAITAIAEAAATKIATIKEEVKEIVVALTLVLHTVLLIVQSVCCSINAVLLASQTESATINSLLLLTDDAIQPITSSGRYITGTVTAEMSLAVGTVSVTLTSLTRKFSASMEKLEARAPLTVTNTLGRIIFKFVKTAGDLVKSIPSSVSTITSSLRIVSASDSGLHSKVCRKLYKIFSILLQLTGSDDEILQHLSKELPRIFEIIKSVTGSLISGLGTEATGAAVKAVTDIIDSLNKMLPFLIDSGYVKVKNIEYCAKEIAKNIQILTSIVSAISEAISGGIDSVTTVIFECVIALQFIHATILYVAEWVSASSASHFLNKSSERNELTTSLAAVIVVMLTPVAKAVSMITTALPDGLSYVVKSTSTFFIEVYKKGSKSFSKVSLVETNTKITLKQITLGSSGTVSVEGFVNGSMGTVSQIFNGVTGSLASFSSTLSSSLSSIDSSLKAIISSKSDLLKKVGSILIFITTKISNITGSVSEILSATLSSLSIVFGNLFDVISKLSILDDISISLGSAVSKIATAVHSIVDAAGDAKVNVYVVNEYVADVAKSVQILISSFSAIMKAAAIAKDDVFKSASEGISAIPYLTSCVVVLVQHILGAVTAAVSLAFGSISLSLQKLTISMSTILESLVSIITELTTLVAVSDGKLTALTSNIVSSVSGLNIKTESSLSAISGVKANMKATLSAKPNPEL